MYHYVIYGMQIQSDLQLVGLKEEQQTETIDLTISEGISDYKLLKMSEQGFELTCDFLYDCNSEYAWVFKPGILMARIEQGNKIEYKLLGKQKLESIKQLIVFICLVIACAQRAMLCMHGSCIRMNQKAFIIGGKSGAGKSTLTTELLQGNAQYMSDDVCAIRFEGNTPYVQSSLPERKLCVDTAVRYGYEIDRLKKLEDKQKDKYMIRQESEFYQDEEVLGGIIIITPNDVGKLAIEEVSGPEKVKLVIEDILYRKLYNRIGNVRELHRQVMEIVREVPIYRFWRPKDQETGKEMFTLFQEYFDTMLIRNYEDE